VGSERRRTVYSGAVQGVGFRWTALRAIQGLPVTGFVRNLRDGTVELVLEGVPTTNDEALARIRAALAPYIRGEAVETGPATGEFRSFEIRR
jgi:acylphosphatase